MHTTSPADAAATYFRVWRERDFDAFEANLTDDVDFQGPMAHVEGAAACRAGIERLSEIVTDIRVLHTWVDGDDVVTWFELHTDRAEPKPVANWTRVRDGRVARVRVTFDPRGLV